MSLQEKDKERDPYGWLFCTSRSGHDPDKLMPTQIIAGNALECMGHLVHSYRKQWNIVQFCDCPEAIESNKSIQALNAANSNGNCKVFDPSFIFRVSFPTRVLDNGVDNANELLFPPIGIQSVFDIV